MTHPLLPPGTDLRGWKLSVQRKKIKAIYIRMDDRTRQIRVSAPHGVNGGYLKDVVVKNLPRILQRISASTPPCPYAYGDAEIHWVDGKPLELSIGLGKGGVALEKGRLIVRDTHPMDPPRVKTVLDAWYRERLRARGAALVKKWEPIMGVSVNELRIRRMRTRWGSCNTRARRIWLALVLAQMAPRLQEYVLVHEMVHLLEPSHGPRFYKLMAGFLPEWAALKGQINSENKWNFFD